MTPRDVDAMSADEYQAFHQAMDSEIRRHNREARRAKKGGR